MSADFLDSNIFVYLFDNTDVDKYEVASTLVDRALLAGNAVISYQVVQETLRVLTQKLPAPLSPDEARVFLTDVLEPLWRVQPTPALYHRALDIQSRYRYSFYDALIVAAALSDGCSRLYSEDFQDGQRIEGLTIVNPFAG